MLGFLALLPQAAWAHAFERRYDLPAPLPYFIAGAVAVVVLSFVVAALFARMAPRQSEEQGLAMAGGIWVWVLKYAARLAGLAALLLVVVAGLMGDPDPMTNIVPTLVWINWWVGFSFIAACLGNIWPAVDPWRSLFDLGAAIARRCRGGRSMGALLAYPAWLGRWPSVGLLLALAWFELLYVQAAMPFDIAVVVLAWSVVNLLGMAVFGRDTWQSNADFLAVYFETLGRFAPVGIRLQGGFALRWPGRGLIDVAAVPLAMVGFVVAMLSNVLFDGLLGGQAWRQMERAIAQVAPDLLQGDGYLLGTAGLLVTWLVFLAAYLLSCWGMARMAGSHSMAGVARAFALTLVPIAVAYNIAHYFSMLAVQGQDLIRLLSDPLGWKWNLFGTVDFSPAIGLIDARVTWFIAIGAIVSGHVISIWLSHRVALREFGDARRAALASMPMTLLMVLYTGISLSIIAEPMVKFSTAH